MGNRGILHDERGQIVRRWTTRAWIACDPGFKGISRKPLFRAGSYSELFFLDEATALSAGHRPCSYCQRRRYTEFKALWASAVENGVEPSALQVKQIDHALHAERVARGVDKVTYAAPVQTMPEGSMFEHEEQAFLVHRRRYWLWSFSGYAGAKTVARETIVRVLTPRSVVRVLEAGFKPAVHASADA